MSPRGWVSLAGLLLGLWGVAGCGPAGSGSAGPAATNPAPAAAPQPVVVDVGGGSPLPVDVTADTAIAPELERAEELARAGKLDAARRVLAETTRWLRGSSVTDPCGYAPSSRRTPAEAAMRRRIAIESFPREQDPAEFWGRL